MKNKLFVLAIATGLGIGASSTAFAQEGEPHTHPPAQPQAKPQAQPQAQPTTKVGLVEQDRSFLKKSQYAELYTIQISRIASEKVTDANVKSFAANVMADHQATLTALNKMATDRGMNTKMLSPKQKGRLSQFNKTGTNLLASEYLTQISKRLEVSIKNLTQVTKTAKDPALITYASSRLPILTAQLKKAQHLKASLKPAVQG